MKKGILLIGKGSSSWIGGLYYIKNIAFVLSQNIHILTNYNIYLLTSQENAFVFDGLPECIHIIVIPKVLKKVARIYKAVFAKMHNIKYIFPCGTHIKSIIGIQGISWIPDFQHNCLTQMYTEEERKRRIAASDLIIKNGNPLVLSSNDCKKDLIKYYTSDKKDVYVIPFVSFIEKDIKAVSHDNELAVLEKYGLGNKKYIYIANQFWQHKNHLVVLEAVNQLLESGWKTNYLFVFTGKMKDPRSPEYIERIQKLFKEGVKADLFVNLGFIERTEQITIMKNAEFLIQPSLFEGWGTVVEDAKVMDKTILLSDIPVHREQMNRKCRLFDPCNPCSLAELIAEETSKKHIDDIDEGISDMYKRAAEYSKGFEQLLINVEDQK